MAERSHTIRDDFTAPGFVKTQTGAGRNLTGQQRALLIRKGNELFNKGSIDHAKRVFLTTQYTDGLIRLGDYYMKHNEPLEAFRMYWLAPERAKAERLVEKMAAVVRSWLTEGDHVG